MRTRNWYFIASLIAITSQVNAQTNEEYDVETLTSSQPQEAIIREDPYFTSVSSRIIDKTNQFRKSHDLMPVTSNQKLTATAQYFAKYMAKHDKYGHTADDQQPSERAKQHHYQFCIVSENIAYLFSSQELDAEELSERFTQGWIDSPEHRKNMVNEYVTEIGVAVNQSKDTGNFYAVQMFARPKSKQIQFAIHNNAQTDMKYQIGSQTFSLRPNMIRKHFRCKPQTLALSEANSKTFTPKNGEQFFITKQKVLQHRKSSDEAIELKER